MEGYKWIRDDNVPSDIWTHKSHFDESKKIIAMLRFYEYNLLFRVQYESEDDRKNKELAWIKEQAPNVKHEDALDFCSHGFGNVNERSLTIIDTINGNQTWSRVKK